MNASELLAELVSTQESMLCSYEKKIVSCDVYASAAVRLLETTPGWIPVLIHDYESMHCHPDDEQDPILSMKCAGSVESGRFVLHYDRTLAADSLRMVINLTGSDGEAVLLSKTVRLPDLQDS